MNAHKLYNMAVRLYKKTISLGDTKTNVNQVTTYKELVLGEVELKIRLDGGDAANYLMITHLPTKLQFSLHLNHAQSLLDFQNLLQKDENLKMRKSHIIAIAYEKIA